MGDYISVVDIEKHISSLSNGEMYDLMWNALDFMQQWNGRSKFECICMALGYEVVEMDDGSKRYRWA